MNNTTHQAKKVDSTLLINEGERVVCRVPLQFSRIEDDLIIRRVKIEFYPENCL